MWYIGDENYPSSLNKLRINIDLMLLSINKKINIIFLLK